MGAPASQGQRRNVVAELRSEIARAAWGADFGSGRVTVAADDLLRLLEAVDAGENLLIAVGMGWDLDGVMDVLLGRLVTLGVQPPP